MRKIIVTEFITLDGVVEAPGGDETNHIHGGWNNKYNHPEAGQYKVDELASVDALLLGKNTYVQFSKYWRTQSGGGFADKINQMPKYIATTSLGHVSWNNCHIIKELVSEVKALKNSEGGNILVYGSATLVRSLLHHNLVDELRLMVHPISIGGGLRIFDDNRELKAFTLTHSRILDNGIIILEYQPAP